MTRINIVEPSELTDQHLVAEYREIFMVGPALQRSLQSKSWSVTKIPKRYTLNEGHVMFFYDKGKYLEKRYEKLKEEMEQRGMSPDPSRVFPIHHFPKYFQKDWEPIDGDYDVIRERIALRISQKPGWYRKNGSLV